MTLFNTWTDPNLVTQFDTYLDERPYLDCLETYSEEKLDARQCAWVKDLQITIEVKDGKFFSGIWEEEMYQKMKGKDKEAMEKAKSNIPATEQCLKDNKMPLKAI